MEPHHFSFNSPMGWCPVCQGLGVQHGANPALLVPDGRMSLRQGAVAVWPDFATNLEFARLIGAIAVAEGFDLYDPLRRPRRPGPTDHPARLGDTWYTPSGGTGALRKSRRAGHQAARFGRSSTRGCSRRSRRPGGSRSSTGTSCRGWSTTSRAPAAWGPAPRRRVGGPVPGFTLDQISRWPLDRALSFFEDLPLGEDERHIAGDLIREIRDRLTFLVDVGLDYLSLSRGTPTLSGGESQRIRLASQIGSGLTGVVYVLDEPTIGLPPPQRPAAGHPAAPPRPGQHAGPGRARPRGDRGGRPPR